VPKNHRINNTGNHYLDAPRNTAQPDKPQVTKRPDKALDIPTSFNAITATRSRSRCARYLTVDRTFWSA
jgi:hypothetical protein